MGGEEAAGSADEGVVDRKEVVRHEVRRRCPYIRTFRVSKQGQSNDEKVHEFANSYYASHYHSYLLHEDKELIFSKHLATPMTPQPVVPSSTLKQRVLGQYDPYYGNNLSRAVTSHTTARGASGRRMFQ